MGKTEGQKSWGWPVVIYVFLAGCGGGTFIFSYLLTILGRYEPVAGRGLLIGPVLVGIGSLLLIFDLGSPARCYRLFTAPGTLVSSWMTRGAWILTAFIILGLAYALPSLAFFEWLPWNKTSVPGQIVGAAAAFLALIVPIYPGFLLGVIRSVPLWNTPVLPPLFFLSGLDTGVALLALVSVVCPAVVGVEGFHLLGAGDIVLIVLLLITLLAYLEIARQGGITAAEPVRLLKSPLFIVGAIVCGMLVPLALLIVSAFASDTATVVAIEGFAGILVLLGGLLLRYGVVTSGVRLAVR
jgi:formate-dependent nitrite reductase membrane component NrfD